MDMYKELYCGWLILAVLIDTYWVMECHMPEGEIYTDTKAYGTSEQALQGARLFVQQYTAVNALREALPEWESVDIIAEEK